MAAIVWPIDRMAEVLGGRVTNGEAGSHTVRIENRELGIKLKLDIDPAGDDIRLVVDRLSKRRPTFVASLVLDQVVGVEMDAGSREIEIVLADRRRLAISAKCTLHLYRPA